MAKLKNYIFLLIVVVQLGAAIVLPPEYQQKIYHETNAIKEDHQSQRIQLINDFVKVKEKFINDWSKDANEADLKIENVKDRVVQEYTTNQLDSVRNFWNVRDQNINRARESDDFIENYLHGDEAPVDALQIKHQTITEAIEGDNFIQSYLGVTGPCVHAVLESEKDVIDSATQSDRYIQTYLDGDQTEKNVFQEKAKTIADAVESDIFLEKYLL